jgi:hypothetical protein
MSQPDPSTIHEWFHLEPDGELTPAQVAELDRQAAASPELTRLRRDVARLHGVLAASRIEVRRDFRGEVMASLPEACWSARHPRAWGAAALALALLGGAAALLTGLGAARLEPASPFVAALRAVADLVGSSVAAGAGLIGASWRGIGLAVGHWLTASVPNAIAFAVLVVGVNLLLWRRLRRRPRPLAAQRDGGEGSPSSRVE